MKEAVKIFIDGGGDLNTKYSDGSTALSLAVEDNDDHINRVVIKKLVMLTLSMKMAVIF